MVPPLSRSVAISEIMQSLRRVFKAIQDYYHEVHNEFGITGPQLWALKTIPLNGSFSLGDLSEKMYRHPSVITGLVDRLEKKGYVMRVRDQKDRRVIKIQLTEEGQKLVKKAPNPIQGKMIYGLNNLDREELNAIHSAMRQLVDIMEAQNVKATFFFDEE